MAVDERAVRERAGRRVERAAQACAALTIAIGLLALSGWATGRLILARLHPDFIPMAPSTALAFLLLGGALLVGTWHSAPSRVRQCACGATGLILLMGLLVLAQYLTGTDLGIEGWLSVDSAKHGHVPVGRMSPLAAGTFIAASLALLAVLIAPAARRFAREMASSAAAGVVVVGALVALGYWGGIPVLSGGSLIPVALPAALAFIFLGAGVLAATGPWVRTLSDLRPVLIAFGIGLTASILVFALVEWQEQDRIRTEFERKAELLVLAFRKSLDDNLTELENVRALFAVSERVDRASFRTFVAQILARHPSIQAFSWSPRVTDSERQATEAAARRDGFPAYRFTERYPDGKLGPALRRAEYAPVLYQEPYAGNEAALGFDNLSNPARRAVLKKAWDTGQMTATGAITLVQDAGNEPELLIFQPVYQTGNPTTTAEQRRAHLLGFVVEVLRPAHLLRVALPDLIREGLEYRLVDATATPQDAVMSASAGAEVAARTGLRFATGIAMADRQWRLELYPAPWYLATKHDGHAWLVLGCGLLLTVFLGTYLLASARHTAEVSQLTEGLRKISRAVEQSLAAVVITDTHGVIEYVNPKFVQVTGYTFEDAIGQNPRILKSGETPPEDYQRLWATITAGEEWRGEFHNRKKNGELFWEVASISPVRSPDGHITHFVAINEDITERKRIEHVLATRTQQLEALRAVGVEITRELDLSALLRLITERVVELIGSGQSMIRLWDEDSQLLVPRAYTGSEARWGDMYLRLGEGVAGTAAQRREGMIVNDFRTSPYAILLLTEGTSHTAVLAEPLLFGDRLVGVLSIDREAEQQPFLEKDRQLLALFATQAAIAIENARLHEEAMTHGRQLGALLRATQSVMSGLDLDKTLQAIVREAATISGAPVIHLYLLEEDGIHLRYRTGIGTTREEVAGLVIRVGESFSGQVVATGQSLMVPDIREDPRRIHLLHVDKHGLVSYLGLPVKRDATSVGVLVFSSTVSRVYSEDEVKFLSTFAQQAAIAIENARLHASALRRSTEFEALLLSSKAIGSSLDLDQVLQAIVQQAAAISTTPIVRLFLLEGGAQLLRCRVAVGFPLKDEPDIVIPAGVSFSGQVAVTGEPLAVPDTREDPRTHYPAHVGKYEVVSYLGLPVKIQDHTLGVLVFNTPAPRAYSQDEIAFLTAFAQQAALAIQNARLHETAVRHGAQLEALLRSFQSVTSGLDLQAILARILDAAGRISGAPHVKVLLLDKATNVLQAGALKGSAMPPVHSFPMGASLSGLVAQRGEPLFIPDARNDPRNDFAQRDRELGIVTYLGLPIKRGDEVLGVLSFNTEVPHEYTAEEMSLLTSLADQAAIAIENARLHDTALRRADQLVLLNQLSQGLTVTRDPVAVVDAILDALQAMYPGSVGQFWRYDVAVERIILTAMVGVKNWESIARREVGLGEGLVGLAALSGQPIESPDVTRDPRFVNQAWAREEGVVAALALPIMHGGERHGGLILLLRTTHVFAEEEVGLLRSFAAQAGIVTANALLYQSIQEHAATLEARVQERTRDLEAARQVAEAASRAKSEFLANMSHELRTPLNATIGFSQLLLEQRAGPLTAKQLRYCENIATAGRRLCDTIDDILTYVELENGKLILEPQSIAVATAVDEALAHVQAEAAIKQLCLERTVTPDLPALTADPARLQQVLRELLGNAVKFTPPGGTVRLTARCICDLQFPIFDLQNQDSESQSQIANPKSQLGDFIEIAVADTGIGIRPEDIPRLFGEFAQLESTYTKHHAGTGIGLALAKRLVELHGGTIAAASAGEGQGSTFTVRLPLGGPPGRAEA